MERMLADLHTHTTASDGTNEPSGNIRLAKEAGLGAVAITDHDTVAGIPEALEAGRKLGVTVVPGVEISTVANGQDIHILGYYMNIEDSAFLQRLEELRRTRDRRNALIIDRLSELGMSVSLQEVIDAANKNGAGETIGRPHIAAVLIAKGYVRTMREAFDRYLGKSGKAYANPPRIHPAEAVGWIHEAGGTAVVAHPGLYGDDLLIGQLIEQGIDGIEAFHSDHAPEDELRYSELCRRHRLLITAGSDFHGEKDGAVFHGSIGARTVDMQVLRDLSKRR
ncbi:PHP domain-containing protein [Ferviditalea candida]|uniref:PHP domain-containing protein n=1 Tax=Ferviditalea candida TaxID=3108399 RepID=A0ABU5ZGC7_9BACL|nr:PHP domain-containing protein [Paenibacillaceae bacterium T2]